MNIFSIKEFLDEHLEELKRRGMSQQDIDMKATDNESQIMEILDFEIFRIFEGNNITVRLKEEDWKGLFEKVSWIK